MIIMEAEKKIAELESTSETADDENAEGSSV